MSDLLLPEIRALRESLDAVPIGSPCGLSGETVKAILVQLEEVTNHRDELFAELGEFGYP